ncbi:MAG: LptF/LptG family permease [Phycisphaera sp.]|nr:MAG: LptF/LptG family permease [Phycisphaera sp.]
MSLLDRYIARQYLINVVALFVILFAFVVTIDVAINLDRFWRIAGARGSADGDAGVLRQCVVTVLLVADFWWPKLLQLFNLMLGLVLAGAMGFTCTQMVRHRELIAVLASGQSLRRVVKPIMIVALGMTLLAVINQETVLPRIAPLLARDHGQAGQRNVDVTNVPMMRDSKDRLLYARLFNPATDTITDFEFVERDPTGAALRRSYGPEATWDGEAWVAEHATVEPLSSPGTTQVGVPVRFETDLDPIALVVRQYADYSQNLSWSQLGQLLEQTKGGDENVRNRLQRTKYGRVSIVLTNLISLVLVMPFFIVRVPGNMVTQALKGAPVAMVALIGGTVGATAPVAGVAPMVSVFIPVIVLLPLAVAVAISPKT